MKVSEKELEAVKEWSAGDRVTYQGEKGIILKVFRKTGLVHVSLLNKGLVMVYPTMLTSGWDGQAASAANNRVSGPQPAQETP